MQQLTCPSISKIYIWSFYELRTSMAAHQSAHFVCLNPSRQRDFRSKFNKKLLKKEAGCPEKDIRKMSPGIAAACCGLICASAPVQHLRAATSPLEAQ